MSSSNYDLAIFRYQSILSDKPEHAFTQSLTPGCTASDIPRLKSLLVKFGDLTIHDGTDHYTPELNEAVKRYQLRHTLVPDGIVGPITRESLNVSISTRIKMLTRDKRKWDIIQSQPGNKVIVNIPFFNLVVHNQSGIEVNSMKVIVGKKSTPTPVFSKTLNYVEVNPSWYVPRSINGEMVRKFRRLKKYGGYSRYFDERPTTIYDGVLKLDPASINWDDPPSNLRFVEYTGKGNPMGKAKFITEHTGVSDSIYMHDTPDKNKFANVRGAYSHGCIRLSNYLSLLESFGKMGIIDYVEAKRCLTEGITKKLYFTQPITLHTVYIMSNADEFGIPKFGVNIYDS